MCPCLHYEGVVADFNSAALLHLNLGIRWKLVVNIMPVTLPPREKPW